MTAAVASPFIIPIMSDIGAIEDRKRPAAFMPDDVASAPPAKKKKPQMKYDPDVPMSKEEATLWRREQRRKRNRESAAASRQRQRDRITELETEANDWKVKYEAIMAQLHALEGKDAKTNATTAALEVEAQTVTPRSSPTNSESNMVSPTGVTEALELPKEPRNKEEPSKMISRHALS